MSRGDMKKVKIFIVAKKGNLNIPFRYIGLAAD